MDGDGGVRDTRICRLACCGLSGIDSPSEGYTPELRLWSVHYQVRVRFSDPRYHLVPDGDSPCLDSSVSVVRTPPGFGQKKLGPSKTGVSGLDLAVPGPDAVGLIAAQWTQRRAPCALGGDDRVDITLHQPQLGRFGAGVCDEVVQLRVELGVAAGDVAGPRKCSFA